MEEEHGKHNEWENIIFTDKGIIVEKDIYEEEDNDIEEVVDIEDWIESNIDDILDIYKHLKDSYHYYFNLNFKDFINFIENTNTKEPTYDNPCEEEEESFPLIVGSWNHINKWYPFLGLYSYEEFKQFTIKYS